MLQTCYFYPFHLVIRAAAYTYAYSGWILWFSMLIPLVFCVVSVSFLLQILQLSLTYSIWLLCLAFSHGL
uniref:Uncharacterized protein n=1 Tax=Rhizophora mucronata TaxID=61149 RepID=A0A2P2PJV7_RHIMU